VVLKDFRQEEHFTRRPDGFFKIFPEQEHFHMMMDRERNEVKAIAGKDQDGRWACVPVR
jgi:hypothetical protein